MKTITVSLKSVSPYNQSRMHSIPKPDKITHNDHEENTWKEKGHWDEKTGEMYIPPMSIKKALEGAAKILSMKIPGEGKKTYTKSFKNGIMVLDRIFIGYTRDNVQRCTINANADGVSGSGKRVQRSFPMVPEWKAKFQVHIVNPLITKDVFIKHLEDAGKYVGIGQFRPENGGYFGRFEVVNVEW